jgi:hypothetical protein
MPKSKTRRPDTSPPIPRHAVLRFTTDKSIRQLRWLMIVVMYFDLVNTIIGQPLAFWRDPREAEEDNHLFYLFLSRGLLIYFIAAFVYSFTAFCLVSIFPKRLALMVILSFIFGHYFGACSWIYFRWSVGIGGCIIYGIILSIAFVLLAFPRAEE